jgi:hypothetical protein
MHNPETMTPLDASSMLKSATLYVCGKRSENPSPHLDEALMILVAAWCQATAPAKLRRCRKADSRMMSSAIAQGVTYAVPQD